jgi:hypothetical protein
LDEQIMMLDGGGADKGQRTHDRLSDASVSHAAASIAQPTSKMFVQRPSASANRVRKEKYSNGAVSALADEAIKNLKDRLHVNWSVACDDNKP